VEIQLPLLAFVLLGELPPQPFFSEGQLKAHPLGLEEYLLMRLLGNELPLMQLHLHGADEKVIQN
jgi:hypothetical protein